MRVVIKVREGTGYPQYYRGIDDYGDDEFVNNLQDAEVMCDLKAQAMLNAYETDGFLWPSIWKTAKLVPVKLIEC